MWVERGLAAAAEADILATRCNLIIFIRTAASIFNGFIVRFVLLLFAVENINKGPEINYHHKQ